MLQEQESRILGYFIEEAKDHLNTIEQGLLNLHDTLEDTEMLNEVFRAAHSVKGGAAMLGIDSIQQTAHHLEDCFKILKECPTIQVDQKLESLFLRVLDTFKELIEHLESLHLTEDVVHHIMSKVEPVFAALHQHLGLLVAQAGKSIQPEEVFTSTPSSFAMPVAPTVIQHSVTPAEQPNLLPVFQSQVMQKLREMLQLFKQPETPQNRQQLQEYSEQLAQLGEQFKLPSWYTLCRTASGAIANGENAYRTLAPVIIKEIKQSQELVLVGRETEITISEKMQALSGAKSSHSIRKN